MNKTEILDFLELPTNATDADIQRRSLEKKAFFERLEESAPNAVLKKLHGRNLEKTVEILKGLGVAEKVTSSAKAYHPTNHTFHSTYDSAKVSSVGEGNEIGWLIRHTENQSIRSFPLYEGITILGREKHPQYNTIILSDDVYVSRQHAKIEISINPTLQIYITDGVGKPSKNGTYINARDSAIQSRVRIINHETIQIGMTKLILKLKEGRQVKEVEKDVEESDYMKTIIINI